MAIPEPVPPPAARAPKGALGKLQQLELDPLLVMWALFLIGAPFYVGPSGLPQPANFLIIAMLPSLLSGWNGRLLDMARPFRHLLAFTTYVTVANLVWTVALSAYSFNFRNGFLMSPTFYVYNSVLLLVLLRMYTRYRERFLRITVAATLVSVALQVGLSFVTTDSSMRTQLMFNNPNQLGYYSLLCACIILLASKPLSLSTLSVSLGLTACCYLALLSASKAALGSIAMLGIALVLSRGRTMLMAALILIGLAITSNPFSRAIEKAQHRIDTDQHHSLLEERGYDRVGNHPEYWLLGSGEGFYERFAETTVIRAHELHSSAATLLFCYGFIGLGLFISFVRQALRGADLRTVVIVMPGFAYGMVHQGLRFSLMWVMFGFAMVVRHHRSARKAASR